MRTIAFVNHKGGVGKTTSVINIAAGLVKKKYKVLTIDADPQANLTTSLLGANEPKKSIKDSFSKDEPLPILIYDTNFSIVPSTLDFSGIELEISNRIARETILRELINNIEKKFDYCLIDCPPSLGLITLNALVAANEVIIPTEAEFLAYRGIDTIVGVIEKVKKHFNPNLRLSGVFFTKYQEQKVLTKMITDKIEECFQSMLLKTRIRVNVSLAESQAKAKDIFEYAPKSNGAADYMELVKEIIKL